MLSANRLILIIAIILVICSVSSIIVSAAQSFNVEIELPDSYKNVNPGNDVWFTIKLLNLANTQRVDVTLNYEIADSNGKSIIHNTKTVAIETQASFVADLKLPENSLPGDYNINVVVNSSMGESTATTALKVSASKNDMMLYYVLAGVIGLVLIIFFVIKSRPILKKIKLKMKINKIVKDKLKKN